ncbi:MAG: TonB-dependent receptor plug domain-containing protein [Vicinamibacterales bacterium]
MWSGDGSGAIARRLRAGHRELTGLVAAALVISIPTSLYAESAQSLVPVASAASSAQQSQDGLSNLPLEQLLEMRVYAASKFIQDVAQAPASVTIVTGDEIRRQGYRTLADVLRTVRGFYVTYDRNYSHLGVRGFQRPGDYNGRVLLLLNGHRLNDGVYDQALLGTESPIDVDLLERVEVIRGPSSSLYGTSAFFGAVNLITRQGRSIEGAELYGHVGSQETRKARITAGTRLSNGFEGLLSATAYGSAGNDRLFFPELAAPANMSGLVTGADGDRSVSVFASGSIRGLSAQLGVGSRTKTIPTAPFDVLVGDARTRTTDVRGFAHVHYTHRVDARTTVDIRGAFDRYAYDGTFAYEPGLFRDSGDGTWLTGEAALNRQSQRHSVTAGLEHRANLRQDQFARDATGVLLDDRRRSQITGLYAEDDFRLHPKVRLNAGIRWDHYFGRFGGTVNPRLGLIVSPAGGTTLKLLYGRAFRAPNPYELYYGQNVISASLRPERIQTVELGIEHRLTPRLQASASVFHNRATDLIVQRGGSDETIDGLYYRNSDRATAKGIELELQGELPGRIRSRLSQVFQDVRRGSDGARIGNSPSTLSTVVVELPVPQVRAVLAFNGVGIGNRQTLAGGVVPSAFVGNASVLFRPRAGGPRFGVTIYNVFNRQWADPGSVEHRQVALPQDGRTVLGRVQWHF